MGMMNATAGRRSPRTPDTCADRRGSALIASLMVVVVVSALGVCMIRMHNAVTRRQASAIDTKRALYVAEAGLSEAFLAVSQGKSGNIASEELPAKFGDGVYWVEATELSGGNVDLVSTGMCGTGRFSLSTVLRGEIDPVASRGIFAREIVVVESACVVDGYDSRLGSYQSQAQESGNRNHTEDGAEVSCNASIYLESVLPPGPPGQELPGMTMVFGDVRPGPGASTVMDPGVLVTGSTAPSSDTGVLPGIELPPLDSEGDLVHDTGVPLVLTMTEQRYDRLRVAPGSVLTLEGPVRIVTGGFQLDSGARLLIETARGPVSVYCTEYLDFGPDSTISGPSTDPLNVSIVVTADQWFDHTGDGIADPPVRVCSRGTFYGFLYAPRTTVILPASLRFFGAVAGERVKLSAGMRFTVDQALAQGENGVSALPKLIAWQIVALPDSPLVKKRTDPLGILHGQGLEPPSSADAHADQFLNIAYFDCDGAFRTYAGSEDGFDWSLVTSTVSVEWDER